MGHRKKRKIRRALTEGNFKQTVKKEPPRPKPETLKRYGQGDKCLTEAESEGSVGSEGKIDPGDRKASDDERGETRTRGRR